MNHLTPIAWVLCILFPLAQPLAAQLTPAQVLVVYNDPGNLQLSDGYQVYTHYQSKRPGIRSLNLDDTTLLPGRVNYGDFKSKIRDKIRAHLSTGSLETTVRVIVLTKGIPHQILDISEGTIGNNANATLTLLKEDNATLASVDSELTLLWHDLDTGEADGGVDSHADNFILNPYYERTNPLPVSPCIDQTSSVNFTTVEALDEDDVVQFRYWQLNGPGPSSNDAGLLYLTARLDGDSLSDALSLIDRGQNILLDRKSFAVILDETTSADSSGSSSNFDKADFTETNTAMAATWEHIIHDKTSSFFVGEKANLVAAYPSTHLTSLTDTTAFLSGYGANHPGGDHRNWLLSFNGQLPHGAVYNAYESYNGQRFGNVAPASLEHGQVADWIASGGTFGIGHVWEPFALAVARNRFLTENFYNNGLTWVEAAWSSIQVISWQNTVIGDPLAKVTFIEIPQLSLSLTGPDYGQEVLENATSVHMVTITADAPVTEDLVVNLHFVGASVSDDFTTGIAGFTHGNDASLTILNGQAQATFALTIVDDSLGEILEQLTIAIAESSLDTNGDGFGEAYGYRHATSRATIPIADSPYAFWQWATLGEGTPAESDTDVDGLATLWEYFWQTSPVTKAADAPTDPLKALKAVLSGNSLTFEVPKTIPSDVRLILETSPNLAANSWTELASKTGTGLWAVTPVATLVIDPSPLMTDEILVTTTDLTRSFRRFRVESIPTP